MNKDLPTCLDKLGKPVLANFSQQAIEAQKKEEKLRQHTIS